MTTPYRDIVKGITAHMRAKDRAVYDVVEEIKKAFRKLQAHAEHPTIVNSITDTATTGTVGSGQLTASQHLFDGDAPVVLSQQPVDQTVLMEHRTTTGKRFRNFPVQQLKLDYTGTEIYVSDGAIYRASGGSPEIYRGISVLGTVTPRNALAATGPSVTDLLQGFGDFQTPTFNSRFDTNQPKNWIMVNNGNPVGG